jgi:hypothetical protein
VRPACLCPATSREDDPAANATSLEPGVPIGGPFRRVGLDDPERERPGLDERPELVEPGARRLDLSNQHKVLGDAAASAPPVVADGGDAPAVVHGWHQRLTLDGIVGESADAPRYDITDPSGDVAPAYDNVCSQPPGRLLVRVGRVSDDPEPGDLRQLDDVPADGADRNGDAIVWSLAGSSRFMTGQADRVAVDADCRRPAD